MKTNKRSEIKIALIWAAVLLIVSVLFRSIEVNEQFTYFLILANAIFFSVFLNRRNKLSCNDKNNNTIVKLDI